MEPTLQVGDYVAVLAEKQYHRGDIVVVRSPYEGGYIIKRIAGVGGDIIEVRDGVLLLNGRYASEPYIPELMKYTLSPPIQVPANELFLLGDNRNHSFDSSVDLLTYPVGSVVGKARFIYYPYSRWGYVHSYPLVNSLGQ